MLEGWSIDDAVGPRSFAAVGDTHSVEVVAVDVQDPLSRFSNVPVCSYMLALGLVADW